ncbi:NUDIX domain-containing protein [Micromonospora sp. WMMA1949]|uniref:NUDIX hydrolase n=1 Tax=Micromonospora sp. WMMA1949 TaxID=3015162 RepID=UPI0022B7299D|nr:NUDIX domain-containing protein [Micromonospora sp. WMMA1949]MCZ7426470.1 NUDIX domain-containing protein [Micromonospora sp. WMMA1949]
MRDEIRALVEELPPGDDLEARHREAALAWLAGTEDIFRRAKPRTPSPHLVAYFLLRDPADGAVLLVDHRLAGMWLPSGGHVEPGEHPAGTVRRELREELGVAAVFAPPFGERPAFLTVTETVGPPELRHTDVSLWYVLSAHRDQRFTPDPVEFAGIRWWTPAEVTEAPAGRIEPHLGRMLTKLAAATP